RRRVRHLRRGQLHLQLRRHRLLALPRVRLGGRRLWGAQVFILAFLGSLMVYLSKWGLDQTPGVTRFDPQPSARWWWCSRQAGSSTPSWSSQGSTTTPAGSFTPLGSSPSCSASATSAPPRRW